MTRKAVVVTAGGTALALALMGAPAAQQALAGRASCGAWPTDPAWARRSTSRPPRTYPRGRSRLAAAGSADQAAFGYAALQRRAVTAGRAQAPWQQVGAGARLRRGRQPGRARVGSAEGHRHHPQPRRRTRGTTGGTVYVGSGGGLWKTTDAGKTFHAAGASLPSRSEGSASTRATPTSSSPRPVRPSRAAARAAGSAPTSAATRGQTWTRPAANVGGNGGQQVSIAPNGAIFVATDRGLWRSTDHGASFANVLLPTNAAGTAPCTEHAGRLAGPATCRSVRVTRTEVYAAVGYVAGNVDAARRHERGARATASTGAPQAERPARWKRVDVHGPGPRAGSRTPPVQRPDRPHPARVHPRRRVLYALVADAGLPQRPHGRRPGRSRWALGHDTSLNGRLRSTTDAAGSDADLDPRRPTSETLTAAPGSSQPILSAASALGYNAGHPGLVQRLDRRSTR